MRHEKNTPWQAALAVTAALVLVFSAVVYGQGGSSGTTNSESGSSAGSGASRPTGGNDFNQQVITEFRANQGKVGGRFANMPVLLLTTTGAKSGRKIIKPLVYTTDGERLVVIASFGGSPQHPAWYHNLVANPEATVEVGSERFRVKATVTTGEERQRLFDRQAAQMPVFIVYQKRTTRQIPVIVLTRIEGHRQSGRCLQGRIALVAGRPKGVQRGLACNAHTVGPHRAQEE
ncbi:MAG: nitroreductase family deazaflavin-dependent oxidoreductase [Candidatus Binatia bacterium]